MSATQVARSKWLTALAIFAVAMRCLAQTTSPLPPVPPDSPPNFIQAANGAPAPLLSPAQLEALVAPVALYPDPLLSQILAASTYPLEIVEASRWLSQNRSLQGATLVDAARTQGWDPSVAALVAFPDMLKNLDRDIRWTASLGNAFLAQQGDVMDAVQRLRRRAQASGALRSGQEERVTTETQGTQSAIDIEPADPQFIYVPQYDPMSVWGPPVEGYYPPAWYPGIAFGFGFGAGIGINAFFGGCCGWIGGGWGWGWGPRWFDRSIYVNNYFMNRYGYQGFGRGSFRPDGSWQHDPRHRLDVPYAGSDVAARFASARTPLLAGSARAQPTRGGFDLNANRAGNDFRPLESGRSGTGRFWQPSPNVNRSVFSGIGSGAGARLEGDRGFAAMRGGFGGYRPPRSFGLRGGGGSFHGGASRGRGR